jgi:hypothetical protein
MLYVIAVFFGALVGALVVFGIGDAQRRKAKAALEQASSQQRRLDGELATIADLKKAAMSWREEIFTQTMQELERKSVRMDRDLESRRREAENALLDARNTRDLEASLHAEALDIQRRDLIKELESVASELTERQSELQRVREDTSRQLSETRGTIDHEIASLRDRELSVEALERDIVSRKVQYDALVRENRELKLGLRNYGIELRRAAERSRAQDERQVVLDEKATVLCRQYLADVERWLESRLTSKNFTASRDRLGDVVRRCREIGFSLSTDEEIGMIEKLRRQYEHVVRVQFEREEQARIRGQIREEQQRQREIDRELKKVENERLTIEAALEKAMAAAKDQHSAEIEALKARLVEAEAKAERTKSQGEQTRAGFVYVISNRGSFGEGIFKVGMTRRLEPLDRVSELSDASVPFPFDVHLMISCQDAPKLENALHRELRKTRINRVNPRKEFFKSSIAAIIEIVERHHGTVEYEAPEDALEYTQSLNMDDADQEFIEHAYDEAEDDGTTPDPESGA